MLQRALNRPRRILMTLDAVGGVWRYAVDLAGALGEQGIECILVGSGPTPSDAQQNECCALHNVTFTWMNLPLDWLVEDESALSEVSIRLQAIAREWDVDLLHLNLPSQAAGISLNRPIVVASHSCLPTWWEAVKGSDLPSAWRWQQKLTLAGFARSDAVIVPTASHGDAVRRAYGAIETLHVVPNATPRIMRRADVHEAFVFAAGRWWDEGKNIRTLDAAAELSPWPIIVAGALDGPEGECVVLRHAKHVGQLPHDSIYRYMERAAIFISTALYEPFGLAVLEAAANGIPLILADIPSFRELWNDAAIFVAPDDARGFAAAITQLAEDPMLCRALGDRAYQRAAGFTIDRQCRHMLAIYAQALTAATMAW